MENLINDIKQWGIDRGIDKCDPLLQTTKTLEECMELQRALIRAESVTTEYEGAIFPSKDYQTMEELKPYIPPKKLTDIKDAIGDIFITLIIIDLQAYGIGGIGFEIKELEGRMMMPFETTTFILEDIRILQYILDSGEGGYSFHLEYIVRNLSYLAYWYNLTLKDCVEFSYNQIKDRTGRIIDGLWEKEY